MPHLNMHDLVLVIPMTLVGIILGSMIPVAARTLRVSCRTAGAVIGALFALIVVETIPMLI